MPEGKKIALMGSYRASVGAREKWKKDGCRFLALSAPFRNATK